MDFTFRQDEGYPIACANCGEGEVEPFVETINFLTGAKAEGIDVCKVCFETDLMKATNYPNQCETSALYQCIARGIWMILRAIEEKQ